MTQYASEDVTKVVKNITCPYLVIKAEKTPYEDARPNYWDNAQSLKEYCKNFCLIELEGNHHIHMTKTEVVAEAVIPFLQKHDI